MKKFLPLLGLLMFVNISFSQVLTENFDYTAGQLISANGWTAHSAAGTNAITVTSPSLTYTGHPGSGVGNAVSLTTNGEDANRGFSAINSGNVYMSFLVNISAVQSAGDYFTGLYQSSSIFPARVYVKSDGSGGFFFGASKGSSTPVVYETTSRSLGQTYLVVVKYTFNTGTTTDDEVNLWVNPALGGTETTATLPGITGTAGDATSIIAAFLRQGSASNAATLRADAILVGTTWEQVTPGTAVPSLNVTSLSAFGNVCINTTAGPNSFTITGSNLTTADVTVAALPGFTFATSAGGPYSGNLTLTQAGGSFSQQIFVNFEPTAVQSYDGNIAVEGGGASSVNVAASGAGVNSMPSVTTGAASALTLTSATAAGSINSTGCSTISAYGIEYSTTSGFTPGTGTQVPSTNLTGGNFSSDLTGLVSGTTYYYIAYASNAGGTAYGTEQSFTTLTANPTLNVNSLTDFGSTCINTNSGPHSFTITGSNLTSANVDVAALPGFTYSTAASGPFTTTLSFTQPGGTFSQEVFVRFTPTVVQSYNGNIVVSGGGAASSVNVAATGSGVNTMATVTTGLATSITQTTAIAGGTIPTTGCSAVSAYGIEYSTTNNFTPGTGTQVPASNLTGTGFNTSLTALSPNTIYYYRAYATNAGGTAYGSQLSFTTLAPTISLGSLLPFGDVCVGATEGPNTFTITGVGLNTSNVYIGALAGYTYSTSAGGTFTPTLSLTQPGGAFSQVIYVNFSPLAIQSYNGNIPVTGGGSVGTANVAASGAGVISLPAVVTGPASSLTNHSVTLAGSIPSVGCDALTAYGIEYSGINGFQNGNGTKVPGTNLSGSGDFTVGLDGLVQGTTYYYKAYAANSGGTSYGLQESFTVVTVGNGFMLYPVPVQRGNKVRVTMNDITPGYYGLLLYNSDGKLVYQHNMNTQAGFINQEFTIPGWLPRGIYRVSLVNFEKTISTKSILVL